jgi:hypothetical protein
LVGFGASRVFERLFFGGAANALLDPLGIGAALTITNGFADGDGGNAPDVDPGASPRHPPNTTLTPKTHGIFDMDCITA